MIYLVYGEDTYRARQFVDTINAVEKKVIDDPAGVDYAFDQLQQANLFGTTPLIIFRNLLNKIEYEHLKKMDRQLHEVVFWEEKEKLDQRKKVVKTLLKGAQVHEFKPLSRSEVKQWTQERLKITKLQNYKIDPAAVDRLIDLHGSNLWFISNELAKLAAYVSNRDDQTITAADVNLLSTSSVEQNIFEFVDAVGNRHSDEALKLLSRLFDEHADEHYLLSMIVRQFRLLTQAKGDCLKGQHPFVIKKAHQQARNWELDELKEMYATLTEIDHKTKTSRTDLLTSLTLLCAELDN